MRETESALFLSKTAAVKFSGADGRSLWMNDEVGNAGNESWDLVTDTANNVVTAGERIPSDGLSRFTAIQLRGIDGTDYSAEPVPETVAKYAPMVYLHPDDAYRPGNPLTFIQNSKLGWSHQLQRRPESAR